jgi:hypothetical protein
MPRVECKKSTQHTRYFVTLINALNTIEIGLPNLHGLKVKKTDSESVVKKPGAVKWRKGKYCARSATVADTRSATHVPAAV